MHYKDHTKTASIAPHYTLNLTEFRTLPHHINPNADALVYD